MYDFFSTMYISIYFILLSSHVYTYVPSFDYKLLFTILHYFNQFVNVIKLLLKPNGTQLV